MSCQLKHVHELFLHPSQAKSTSSTIKSQTSIQHLPQVVDVIGVIESCQMAEVTDTRSYATVTCEGKKRLRTGEQVPAAGTIMQISCTLRDLHFVDFISISIDAAWELDMDKLDTGCVVTFHHVKINVAKNSYKVYVNWNAASSSITVSGAVPSHLSTPMLYGSMKHEWLEAFYRPSLRVDRRLHRLVVRVVHFSYVYLKRRCRQCQSALLLDKARSQWLHVDNATKQPYRGKNAKPKCFDAIFVSSSPDFNKQTRVSTTIRCVVDDSSAQADLFLEDSIAWELLQASSGTSRILEQALSDQVQELSFFPFDAQPSSELDRKTEELNNLLKELVMKTIVQSHHLRVIAHRFYTAASWRSSHKTSQSTITYGKQVHVTTKTAPMVQLQATQVDPLHIKSEARDIIKRIKERIQ